MRTNAAILLGAAFMGAAMLSACSSDSPSGSEIQINATVSADGTYQELINGSTFSLTAFADGLPVIDGAVVSKVEGVCSYSPEAHWPDAETSFYAYSPISDAAVTLTPQVQQADYACPGDADFIYAAATGIKRGASGAVNLNFRHALSRVVLKWAAPDSKLIVTVQGVTLEDVAAHGTFAWPKTSTGIGAPYYPGQWTLADEAPVDYVIAEPQPQAQLLQNEGADLCTTMRYYFIPQRVSSVKATANVNILDAATGETLWPAPGQYRPVTVALSAADISAWTEGTQYTYTISIAYDGSPPRLTVKAESAAI